ncbi:hypothetical protein EV360DRAFT_84681 [Lentinula raphanica]|nr:hypothetical protein EV360DRAFT_84681 [Lentinula raphanica]
MKLLDLTGAEFTFPLQFKLNVQQVDDHATYPPSVPPSPITSAAVTPDTSESHASDSYFSTPEERSPPPPLSLLDQLHMAYALDDLPLAKMLLLKITQNVQDITSRTDPRLDLVKPEDFDVAFLPKGGLMSPEDEARLVDRQETERKRLKKEAEEAREQARRQSEKLETERREQEERDRIEKEERERVERERAWEGWVEGVWGSAKKEMKEMKEMRELARRRQEEDRIACQERRRQEDERRRVMADRRRAQPTKGSISTPLPRISYAHLPTTRHDFTPSAQSELLYTLPNIPKLSTQRQRISRIAVAASSPNIDYTTPHLCSLRKATRPSSSSLKLLAPQFFDDPSLNASSSNSDVDTRFPPAVSVQEVFAAMRGELFPSEVTQSIQRDCSQHTLHGRRHSDDLVIDGIRQRSKTPNLNVHISSSTSSATRRQRRDDALFTELLSTPDDQLGVDRLRNRRAGKGKDDSEVSEVESRAALRVDNSASVTSTRSDSICNDCSASIASPSTVSSSSARSGSWLSFISSSSASSVSTELTTPSDSEPMSSPIKPPIRTGSVFSTWLKGVASQSSPSQTECRSCGHLDAPRIYNPSRSIPTRLCPVGKTESPLSLDLLDETSGSSMDNEDSDVPHLMRTTGDSEYPVASSAGSSTLFRSMSQFLDLAKSFQSAYLHAATFAAVASVPNVSAYSNDWDREYERKTKSKVGDRGGGEARRNLRPVGCRVDKLEVSAFTSAIKKNNQLSHDADAGQPVTVPNGFRPRITPTELFPPDDSAQYIPMISRKLLNAEHPPRTHLPDPLPFTIHFKPPRPLTGSPVRRWSFEQLQAHTRLMSKRRPVSPPRYGPNGFRRPSRRSPSPPLSASQPILRPRFVGNPIYLRLKALQNSTGIPVTDSQVVELREEGVCIKGGFLGSGKEKVLGTAFEDVGRSRLGIDLLQVTTVQHRVSLPINSPLPWWHRPEDLDEIQLRWEDGSVRRGRSVVKG